MIQSNSITKEVCNLTRRNFPVVRTLVLSSVPLSAAFPYVVSQLFFLIKIRSHPYDLLIFLRSLGTYLSKETVKVGKTKNQRRNLFLGKFENVLTEKI